MTRSGKPRRHIRRTPRRADAGRRRRVRAEGPGLVDDGTPVRLAVDETLFRRSGRKVFGTGWHHDPLGARRDAIAWGNAWVVVGVLVALPMLPHRVVCLRILARLWRPGRTPGRLDLAVERSSWSAATSATVASTWTVTVTAPTPARRCAGCPPRPPSPAGCAPMPPCTSSPGRAGSASAAGHPPKAPACPSWPRSPAWWPPRSRCTRSPATATTASRPSPASRACGLPCSAPARSTSC